MTGGDKMLLKHGVANPDLIRGSLARPPCTFFRVWEPTAQRWSILIDDCSFGRWHYLGSIAQSITPADNAAGDGWKKPLFPTLWRYYESPGSPGLRHDNKAALLNPCNI